MSAAIKRIPRDQRLRITARYEHEVVSYEGNVFEFIEKLMAEKYTGFARVKFNFGGVMGMEFDFRKQSLQDADTLPLKNVLDMGKESP